MFKQPLWVDREWHFDASLEEKGRPGTEATLFPGVTHAGTLLLRALPRGSQAAARSARHGPSALRPRLGGPWRVQGPEPPEGQGVSLSLPLKRSDRGAMGVCVVSFIAGWGGRVGSGMKAVSSWASSCLQRQSASGGRRTPGGSRGWGVQGRTLQEEVQPPRRPPLLPTSSDFGLSAGLGAAGKSGPRQTGWSRAVGIHGGEAGALRAEGGPWTSLQRLSRAVASGR